MNNKISIQKTFKRSLGKASLVLLILGLFSCSTKKQILYLQDIDTYNNSEVLFTENTIQHNDILSVVVSSSIIETAAPYNKTATATISAGQNRNYQNQGYLVSKDLEIKLPILGNVSVANKTIKELETVIENLLVSGEHLRDPTVMISLLNAKFTTLGEMGTGTHYFSENNLTILQAIGMAGDLNINGLREDIVLIREIDGKRNIVHLDLTSATLFDSPYYYIKPNDLIYVKPNDVRVRSAGFITGPTALIGLGTLIVSTILLVSR